MKRNSPFFALLLACALTAPNLLKAQDAPHAYCIHDEYAYVWSLTVIHHGDIYKGTGTVDVGAGFDWDAICYYNSTTGEVSLEADNPQADGCNSGYVDYFKYTGTATADWSSFSGGGSWLSYCSGGVINSGDWDATDCAHKGMIKKTNGPAKHSGASLIKVNPNPINGLANISYSVAQSGKVSITVYNSMQQVVKVLVSDFKNAGNYSTTWDSRSGNVNAGVYRVVAIMNGKTYSTTVQVIR